LGKDNRGCWLLAAGLTDRDGEERSGTGTTPWSGGSSIRGRQVSTISKGWWDAGSVTGTQRKFGQNRPHRAAHSVSRPLCPQAEASQSQSQPCPLALLCPVASAASAIARQIFFRSPKPSSRPRPRSEITKAILTPVRFPCSASWWPSSPPPFNPFSSPLRPPPLSTSPPLCPSNIAHDFEGNTDFSRQATRSYNILSSNPEHRC
jgi:hypothetical protein